MTSPRVDDDVVFGRLQACLANLVGGSGHLASYRLRRDSFEVTAVRDVGDGDTEFEFVVKGDYVSEFTGLAGEDDGQPNGEVEPRQLTGSIVLDGSGDLVLDDEGRVRLEPWRTLDPDRWPDRERDDDLDEFLADLDVDQE